MDRKRRTNHLIIIRHLSVVLALLVQYPVVQISCYISYTQKQDYVKNATWNRMQNVLNSMKVPFAFFGVLAAEPILNTCITSHWDSYKLSESLAYEFISVETNIIFFLNNNAKKYSLPEPAQILSINQQLFSLARPLHHK